MYRDPLHVSYERLTVVYNGKEMFMLNKRLLDRQNCRTGSVRQIESG